MQPDIECLWFIQFNDVTGGLRLKKLVVLSFIAMFVSQSLSADDSDTSKRIATALESIAESLKKSTEMAAQYSATAEENAAEAPATS